MQPKTLIIILIVLVIAVPTAAYSVSNHLEPKEKIIKDGSTVSLFYYGYIFINGTPVVFDTNMQSIANNNVTYPKAPDFKYHPPFSALNDTVGSGQMIKGFDYGLIGMAQGQTGLISISPANGYGLMNTSLIHRENSTGTAPVYQEMTVQQFYQLFSAYPSAGETYTSPIYGWKVNVLGDNGNDVYIENNPMSGGQYYPFANITGLSIVVENITGSGSSSTINYYTSVANGTLLPDGAYISAVGNGFFDLNYNSYLVGRTLYFYVQIVSVS